jgi:3-phosphoshikimate 1-carboxyvinyltransferase
MKRWRVHPAKAPLRGAIRVPGDKSIGHRAIILASIAQGSSLLAGLSPGEDNRATRAALVAMGVAMRKDERGALRVEGVGLRGLRPAPGPIDCGNSGTTMRLLAGLLAAQHFDSVLVGDASLSRRPMARVTRPLRDRGARIDGVIDPARNDETAPLEIRALPRGGRLNELAYRLPVPSAQVKTALILSGLDAAGPTLLEEPVVTRDHTERMLAAMGLPIETVATAVGFDPSAWNGVLAPLEITIPGDLSSAAFPLVAAHLLPGSRLIVRGVGVNPTRTGVLDVLRDMGGGVIVEPRGDAGGEPVGDLHVGAYEPAELRSAARVGGELAVRAIDEIPALVAAAAGAARGTSEFRDLQELRVKETDRIAALVAMLRAFALDAEPLPDGLRVGSGRRPRGGATIQSRGDHRIAMAGAVLALVAEGETVVEDVACVDTSFPSFVPVMRRLGAQIDEQEG